MELARLKSGINFVRFYLILICCLFPVVNIASRSKNLRRNQSFRNTKRTNRVKYFMSTKDRNKNLPVDCSYHNGQFLCEDGLKCIDLIDTCNGECNCWDCSDEKEECWKYDEYSCRTCRHLCLPTPHGPQCLCNDNNYKFSLVCEIYECSKDNNCDQRCVKYEGIERCSCDEHYRGKPNTYGKSCISEVPHENLLVYSTNDEIKIFNFTANDTYVIQDNVQCKGLSAAGQYVYYGVAQKNTGYISKTSISTMETDQMIETYSPIIFSIEVDWLTGNIYFSTDKSLGVCSNNGYYCALIKRLSLTDWCHIGLAPRSGLLFHSTSSIYYWFQDSRIMKSAMDGSNETVLVTHGLRHPISITVDEWSQKLYWLDSDLGEIESVQFNGLNRKILYAESRMHIFAINKFENNLFWTEEKQNTIGINFEANTKFIRDLEATNVKYLHAYNPLLQKTKIPNPCSNMTCNGLCLLRPTATKELSFTCLCENYTPSSTQRWCNNHSTHADWQFETDFEYEVRPLVTQQSNTGKLKWILSTVVYIILITLGSVSVYLIFRRKSMYRYYDRVWNRNWDPEEHAPINEYIEM